MNTTTIARQTAAKARGVSQSPLVFRCTAARWYATAAPQKPPPKKSTPTNKAKPAATTKSKRAVKYEQEDTSPLASRMPFVKPSTSGLGVPSKSPSAAKSHPSATSDRTRTAQDTTVGDASALAGDASLTAEQRDAQLRTARLRRVDQERERAAKEEAEKDYKQRYNKAVGRWVRGIIAAPILLVTSYYLFDRREWFFFFWPFFSFMPSCFLVCGGSCWKSHAYANHMLTVALGNQPTPIPKVDDDSGTIPKFLK